MERKRASLGTLGVRGRGTFAGTEGNTSTYLLRTLLLCEHILLLRHDLGLVLQAERKGQSHEKGASGDYPYEVSDDLGACAEEGRGRGKARGYFGARGGRDDVDEGRDPLVEGLLGFDLVVRLERGGRGCSGGREVGGALGVVLVLLLNDLYSDHGGRC